MIVRKDMCIAAIVGFLWIGYMGGNYDKDTQIASVEKKHNHHFKHFKSMVGYIRLSEPNGEIVRYNLKSFDGGTNWYQIEYDKSSSPWKMKILGNVNDVNPELFKSISEEREPTKIGYRFESKITAIDKQWLMLD